MAHDAIIEKLERELQEPITSERQVVYLLVEIRKLIELNQDSANYKTLKFCCDWVAHPVLEGSEARSIVRQLDKYQKLIEEMNNAADGEALTADMSFLDALDGVLRLSRFRSELGAYLGLRGLSSSIADCDKEWANFLTYYARVIEDCPLRCVRQGMKYADEVVLKVIAVKPEPAASLGGYQLVIEWSWISKITGVETKSQQFY